MRRFVSSHKVKQKTLLQFVSVLKGIEFSLCKTVLEAIPRLQEDLALPVDAYHRPEAPWF
jgi:hypothetical protein